MNDLGVKIKKYREEKGIPQVELAKKAGIGSGTLGDIERGANKTTPKTLNKIIAALEIDDEKARDILQAFLGTGSKKLKGNVIKIDEQLITIPVKAIASAGNGFLNFEGDIKTVIIRKNGFDERCYLIEVSGDSMEPLIQDGAYIVVDPRETDLIDNKIYVVNYDGQTYIKKVTKNEQLKAVILKSINPAYDDIYITDNMLDRFVIKGRAVKFILEGRL